eukprot:g913.t1
MSRADRLDVDDAVAALRVRFCSTLKEIYARYNPEKLDDVDAMVDRLLQPAIDASGAKIVTKRRGGRGRGKGKGGKGGRGHKHTLHVGKPVVEVVQEVEANWERLLASVCEKYGVTDQEADFAEPESAQADLATVADPSGQHVDEDSSESQDAPVIESIRCFHAAVIEKNAQQEKQAAALLATICRLTQHDNERTQAVQQSALKMLLHTESEEEAKVPAGSIDVDGEAAEDWEVEDWETNADADIGHGSVGKEDGGHDGDGKVEELDTKLLRRIRSSCPSSAVVDVETASGRLIEAMMTMRSLDSQGQEKKLRKLEKLALPVYADQTSTCSYMTCCVVQNVADSAQTACTPAVVEESQRHNHHQHKQKEWQAKKQSESALLRQQLTLYAHQLRPLAKNRILINIHDGNKDEDGARTKVRQLKEKWAEIKSHLKTLVKGSEFERATRMCSDWLGKHEDEMNALSASGEGATVHVGMELRANIMLQLAEWHVKWVESGTGEITLEADAVPHVIGKKGGNLTRLQIACAVHATVSNKRWRSAKDGAKSQRGSKSHKAKRPQAKSASSSEGLAAVGSISAGKHMEAYSTLYKIYKAVGHHRGATGVCEGAATFFEGPTADNTKSSSDRKCCGWWSLLTEKAEAALSKEVSKSLKNRSKKSKEKGRDNTEKKALEKAQELMEDDESKWRKRLKHSKQNLQQELSDAHGASSQSYGIKEWALVFGEWSNEEEDYDKKGVGEESEEECSEGSAGDVPQCAAAPPAASNSGFVHDDWQLAAFEVVDRGDSLLVTAPTSAGKTEVSLRAARKVLLESDDGCAIFVVPTKALVTQMYAELLSRFQKHYKYAGRVLAGMFTGSQQLDVGICQLLVTVPQCLQMVLEATNTRTSLENHSSHSASKGKAPGTASSSVLDLVSIRSRLRCVLLDEVHQIGEQNGNVWEAVLTLLPQSVQFVALSATLGRPEHFLAWLQSFRASPVSYLLMTKAGRLLRKRNVYRVRLVHF